MSKKHRMAWMFFAFILALPFAMVQAAEPATVQVWVDELNRTYLPVRSTYEQWGFHVSWDAESRTAYIEDKGEVICSYSLGEEAKASLLRDSVLYTDMAQDPWLQKLCYNEVADGVFSIHLPGVISVQAMMDTLQQITATPRAFGEAESEAARELIIAAFREYGYQVELQEFSLWGEDAEDTKVGSNIIATKMPQSLRSNGDILIVAAHYDSVEESPGANDNGCGVSVLLELARLIKDLPSDTEVRLIAFDGEEYFLQGSHYYASSLDDEEISRIVGMINFDMFSAVDVDGPYLGTIDGEANFLTELFDGFSLRDKGMSDHASFFSLAVPSMQIGQNADSRNHQPEDTIEFIEPEKLQKAAEGGLKALAHILSDATPSLKAQETPSALHVAKIDLLEPMEFIYTPYTQKAYEQAHGIAYSVTIPVKMPNPFVIQSTVVASIDWFGSPLETSFIYEPYLSYIHVKLDHKAQEEAIAILDRSMISISDPERYDSFYMTDEMELVRAWKDGQGSAYVLFQAEDAYRLTIQGYRSVHSFASKYLDSPLIREEQRQAWLIIKPLCEQAGILDDIVRADFYFDSYGDDLLLSLSPDGEGIKVTIAMNEILDEDGRLYRADDLQRQFDLALAAYISERASETP